MMRLLWLLVVVVWIASCTTGAAAILSDWAELVDVSRTTPPEWRFGCTPGVVYKEQGDNDVGHFEFAVSGNARPLVSQVTIFGLSSRSVQVWLEMDDRLNDEWLRGVLRSHDISFTRNGWTDISNTADARRFLVLWLASCTVKLDAPAVPDSESDFSTFKF
jgi:hypothetical protein